jgi:hypothetical protein
MGRTIKSIACVITLLLTAKLLGWDDGFHWIWGGALMATLGVILFVVKRRRTTEELTSHEDDPVPESPLRSVLVGMLAGGACVTYLSVGLFLFKQVPWIYAGYYDRERVKVEEKVQILVAANNPAEAARVLAERMKQKMSSMWRRDAAKRLYDCLIQAAQTNPDLTERVGILSEAQRVAQHHALEYQFATILLTQANQAKAFHARVRGLQE